MFFKHHEVYRGCWSDARRNLLLEFRVRVSAVAWRLGGRNLMIHHRNFPVIHLQPKRLINICTVIMGQAVRRGDTYTQNINPTHTHHIKFCVVRQFSIRVIDMFSVNDGLFSSIMEPDCLMAVGLACRRFGPNWVGCPQIDVRIKFWSRAECANLMP